MNPDERTRCFNPKVLCDRSSSPPCGKQLKVERSGTQQVLDRRVDLLRVEQLGRQVRQGSSRGKFSVTSSPGIGLLSTLIRIGSHESIMRRVLLLGERE